MRVLLQRVSQAKVVIGDETVGQIGAGLLLLVGVGASDADATPTLAASLAQKIVNLRIFPDAEDKMNRSLLDSGGDILAVSQFTLYADCRKGRRPSFIAAAPPETGSRLFDAFVTELRALGARVETGRFGAMMNVHLINDGPVTIWLDTDELFG